MRKLYIFDLDDTLYLGRASPRRRSEYEARLVPYLTKLHGDGHFLTVASSNCLAKKRLSEMGLLSLFHMIISDETISKAIMVQRIRDAFPSVKLEDVTYYDDDFENVLSVSAIGVKAVNVAPLTGVRMGKVDKIVEVEGSAYEIV